MSVGDGCAGTRRGVRGSEGTCEHTHTHSYTCTYTHTCAYTYTCTHTHIYIHLRIHMHTHANTHTNTYTYSHTHTHPLWPQQPPQEGSDLPRGTPRDPQSLCSSTHPPCPLQPKSQHPAPKPPSLDMPELGAPPNAAAGPSLQHPCARVLGVQHPPSPGHFAPIPGYVVGAGASARKTPTWSLGFSPC